jgi:endoglucanase
VKKPVVKRSSVIAGIVLVILCAVLIAAPHIHPQTRIFSNERVLLELWSTYKKTTLEPGTLRTLDKSLDNITTSEGESYTMLRSVWMDDRTTFDASWKWTKDNLQRDDKLLSWRFGKLADGNYGVQTTIGGDNSASDGDSDTALALLMAYKRWKEPMYLYDATPLIQSIWENEVVMVNGKPVLTANNLEKNNPVRVLVNPSYLSPYAYKAFAEADLTHDWLALADNSYAIIAASAEAPIDATTSVKLPPNWVYIDRTTGAMTPASVNLDTHYGYDAFRTPWRLALDWEWYKDPRAMAALQKFNFLADQWIQNQKLAAIYSHDGKVISADESHAAYATNLGYFMVVHPALAEKLYQSKILPLYNPDKQSWKTPLGYYDDNWVWFGMALYNHALPNLAGDRT